MVGYFKDGLKTRVWIEFQDIKFEDAPEGSELSNVEHESHIWQITRLDSKYSRNFLT